MVVNTRKVSRLVERYLPSEDAGLDLLKYGFCDAERDSDAMNAVNEIFVNQMNMDSQAVVLLCFEYTRQPVDTGLPVIRFCLTI